MSTNEFIDYISKYQNMEIINDVIKNIEKENSRYNIEREHSSYKVHLSFVVASSGYRLILDNDGRCVLH